ncbi:MAG: CoA-binding protein [Victivallales bacterium]|nr:CoA-binding protein [Victivallales bacterium]
MNSEKKTVVVLGASPKPERYSNKALAALLEHGCSVVPVNPGGMKIHDLQAEKSLASVNSPVTALTVYVSPQISSPLEADIIRLAPRLVIFNPGTENPELEKNLNAAGLKTLHACTLVLLHTGQFEEAVTD